MIEIAHLQHKLDKREMALDGKRLRHLREKAKLTQLQVAEAIGRREQAVGRYERGEGEPSADIIVALAKLLNSSASFLLGELDYEGILDDDIATAIRAFDGGDIPKAMEIMRKRARKKRNKG